MTPLRSVNSGVIGSRKTTTRKVINRKSNQKRKPKKQKRRRRKRRRMRKSPNRLRMAIAKRTRVLANQRQRL